jgi:hypothetical protein
MIWRLRAAWRNRAFPRSLAALRHARGYYSQFAEDAVLACMHRADLHVPAEYLDIGCWHPIQWSNTYGLYLRGWSGYCIDANSELRPLWRKHRPRDQFFACAISAHCGSATYIRSPGFSHENRIELAAGQDPPDSIEGVRTQTLATFVESLGDAAAGIRVMSVDCEGHDLEVLRSNRWDLFRPEFLIVEDRADAGTGPIFELCSSVGYVLKAVTSLSRIYRHRERLGRID